MIRLSFHDDDEAIVTTLRMADLRVTGSVLWDALDHGMIARYTDGGWKYQDGSYPSVGVAGGACLLFGTARQPAILTEPIGLFSFTGAILRANGVPVAQYVEQSDMWQGLLRPFWWNAMRIIGIASAADFIGEPNVLLQNPWDPKSPAVLDLQ